VRRAICLLVGLLFVGGLPTRGEAAWTRLRSANFLFIGDAPEGDIRAIARNLEQFRDALARALPNSRSQSVAPTIVLVFASHRSFLPFMPRFEGRTVEVGGIFRGGADVNYIALNVEQRAAGLRTAFHEYTHLLVSDTITSLPLWLEEGLAEFYEAFEERDGGESAIIGAPAAHHLQTLRGRFMPLAELMAVDHSSPIYNENIRRGLFYSQSWALTHYLLLGNRDRMPQLDRFIARLGADVQPEDAFREAFQMEVGALEKELRGYVQRFSFPAVRVEFDVNLRDIATARGERIADWEAQSYLGDFLARDDNRSEEGRAALAGVLKGQPDAWFALTALGLLEQRSGNLEEALSLLRPAATLAPDDALVQAAYARALLARFHADPPGDTDETVLALAHTAISRAVALNSNRPYYRLVLANILLNQDEIDLARTELLSILAAGGAPHIRQEAREMLEWAAAADSRQRLRSGTPDSAAPTSLPLSQPQPDGSAGSLSGAAPDLPAATSSNAGGGRFIPDLRRVQAGETRVLGMFEGVECLQDLVVLRVRVDNQPLRLAASGFDEIDFISYRAGAPAGVQCGPLPEPQRVLATYRTGAPDAPSPEGDGRAVAIELIPDGYVPR
jgi:tetratricopeptide (TPR) repeat protein